MTAHVTKEIRALAPTWLAVLAVVGASAFGDPKIMFLGMVAGGLGAAMLAAQSIGHEYTHRTLGLLLAQPLDRRRLLLTKVSVLIAMLAVLAAAAWIGLVSYAGFPRLRDARGLELISIVALCALCLAPWLTMLSRSALAGTVFTIAIPGGMWTLTELFSIWVYGLGRTPESSGYHLAGYMYALVALCVSAAIASWRMFVRLEVIEGRGAEVQLPGWSSGTALDRGTDAASETRPGHPIRLLIQKELRLQQMAFVLAGLHVLGWTVAAVLERYGIDSGGLVRGPLTFLYSGLLSIVIGSLASAEERQLGTHATQLLLPMAAWKQWAVKAGTAIGLAVVLGIGVPLILSSLDPSLTNAISGRHWLAVAGNAVAVTVITIASLYLSSLCDSGIRALVLALPVCFVVVVVRILESVLWSLSYHSALRPFSESLTHRAAFITQVNDLVFVLLAVAFVGLLLTLAFRNHRTLDRGAARVLRQAAVIVGFIVAGQALLAGVWVAFVWIMRS